MIDFFKLEMSLRLRMYIPGQNIWNKIEKALKLDRTRRV